MEEANEDTFALNKLIMGSAQKPILFDPEGGRILYGEETLAEVVCSEWLQKLIDGVQQTNQEPNIVHQQKFTALDNLKKSEVDFLQQKHLPLRPEPRMWLPGSGQCPVPPGPRPC